MKKITFAIAALAVVLFAGCNKEESTVTLRFGGEVCQSSDKEGWSTSLNQVLFTQGDALLLNGVRYSIDPIEAPATEPNASYTSTSASYYGEINASVNCINSPAYVYYPAGIFNGTTATLVEDRALVENDMNNVNTMDGTNAWPMVSYLSNVTADSRFLLYNTTGLVSPAVKFGRNFLLGMNGKGYITLDEANSPNTQLDITNIRLVSTDVYLSGKGQVQNVESTELGGDNVNCNLVLTDDLSYEVTSVANVYGITPDPAIMHYVGNVAVPQFANGHLMMIVDFAINGAEFRYTSAEVEVSLARSQRLTLIANFMDAVSANRVEVL